MHAQNGSTSSALTLCDLLQEGTKLSAWSLPVHDPVSAQVQARFRDRGIEVGQADTSVSWQPGANFFFHMGEYPIVFNQHAEAWRPVFERAASVQFSINFSIGMLPQHPWLADYLSVIYFQNTEMADLWQRRTESSHFEQVPVVILPPPVDINVFLEIAEDKELITNEKVVIGLLSGSCRLARGVVDFYRSLAECLPEAEFWFMPTPEIIRQHFSGHPRFRLFDKDEMPVSDFIKAMDIYCLPSNPNAQTLQGTRTLVEVMAAGKACVVVDRLGPRDRIVQGESGYKTNHLDEMEEYVVSLANDAKLRTEMGSRAHQRACGWPLSRWRDAILSYVV